MKYVYLARVEGTEIYKIGFTKKEPHLRLEALQTGNPFKIVLVDFYMSHRATKIESILHRRYQTDKYILEDDNKLLGEWFRLKLKDVISFKETCKQIDTNLNVIEQYSTFTN